MFFKISDNLSNNVYTDFVEQPYENIIGFSYLIICWF